MTARVLVVDDIPANVKLLEVRLNAEYFEVLTATNGAEALAICERAQVDIVLLDIMMPEMDGFEVCRRLKANPRTHHIPVVIVTALDQPSDRVRGLQAGADDFLTKPINDVSLIARVKSLARLKMLTDELRMRADTSRAIGIEDAVLKAMAVSGEEGRVLVVEDRPSSSERMVKALAPGRHIVDIEDDAQQAVFRAAEGGYDLVIVSLGLRDFDALRLCSQIRSLERTRFVPLLIVTEPDDTARLLRGLDMGVNDYIVRPVERNETLARVNTQVKRKRYADLLRSNVQQSIELAITDPLTGLFNRRYMDGHLGTLATGCVAAGKPLSVMIADIDFFKSVNDTYGHDAGDQVLQEFARRLKRNIRGIDLACRIGGEEFVVVMPDTDLGVASTVAERMRSRLAAEPFIIGEHRLEITVSVGLATFQGATDTPERILKRADKALYDAKRCGRNRVVLAAA